jgi:hypothetical protein
MDEEAPVGTARDRVRDVLSFQGRRQDWLALQTGISYERLGRLLDGRSQYWDWEAEQVSLALQVPVGLLFPDVSVLKQSARQRGTSRRVPEEEGSAQAVAS